MARTRNYSTEFARRQASLMSLEANRMVKSPSTFAVWVLRSALQELQAFRAGCEECFCGCCGNVAPEGLPWCDRCEGHVCVGFPPWENTYEALTGKPCPFQVNGSANPQEST